MRIQLVAAGVAVAALIPSFAMAQQTCEQRQANRAVGTVAGAGIGALLGSAVAGRGDRTAGAVVGGLGGALLGNQISKGQGDCSRAYGYYDTSGAWHASSVSRENAQGYFDRDGQWIDGPPTGHYDRSGRWTTAIADTNAAGYYDSNRRWVPASATGYYANGRWVEGAASGYYNRQGRWIAGPTTGRYDANGRWISGPAQRMSDTHAGYYDQGQWRRGPVTGYYDTQGRWIRVDADNGQMGQRDRASIDERQNRLNDRIRRGLNDGTLTRREGEQALNALDSINRDHRYLQRRNGNLRPRDEQMLQARLDNLSQDVRAMGRGPVRQY